MSFKYVPVHPRVKKDDSKSDEKKADDEKSKKKAKPKKGETKDEGFEITWDKTCFKLAVNGNISRSV